MRNLKSKNARAPPTMIGQAPEHFLLSAPGPHMLHNVVDRAAEGMEST